MADFDVAPDVMREYADVLDGLHAQIDKINDYMRTTACDNSGFTGLFMLLRPVVDLVRDLYGDTLQFGHTRLTSLSQGVQSAATAYEQHDAKSAEVLKQLGLSLDDLGPSGQGQS